MFYCLLIFLRKLQYDQTEKNLLGLNKWMNGSIKRTSIFTQPSYHVNYNHLDMQISFYSDYLDKTKVDYINYTIFYPAKMEISFKDLQWLNKMGYNQIDFPNSVKIGNYLIENLSEKSKKRIIQDTKILESILLKLKNTAYLVINSSGLMSELLSRQIIVDTMPETHILHINALYEFIDCINRIKT